MSDPMDQPDLDQPDLDEPMESSLDELLSVTERERQETQAAAAAGLEPYEGPLIEFSHVSISFDERPVLDDVSFSVERGETLCILGRSGVGKSVSLRMLMGFLKPDSGRVIVAHEDITGMRESELRRIRRN